MGHSHSLMTTFTLVHEQFHTCVSAPSEKETFDPIQIPDLKALRENDAAETWEQNNNNLNINGIKHHSVLWTVSQKYFALFLPTAKTPPSRRKGILWTPDGWNTISPSTWTWIGFCIIAENKCMTLICFVDKLYKWILLWFLYKRWKPNWVCYLFSARHSCLKGHWRNEPACCGVVTVYPVFCF